LFGLTIWENLCIGRNIEPQLEAIGLCRDGGFV
jgi:hypothetical protein